jgi:hypothetical protein
LHCIKGKASTINKMILKKRVMNLFFAKVNNLIAK